MANPFARSTLFERVLTRFHMNYELAAFFVALFVGPLGNFLFSYSATLNAEDSFYKIFGQTPGVTVNLDALASNLFWYGFLFFAVFSIRYLRLRLVRSEPVLVSLSPDGEKAFRSAFGFVSSASFQLVLIFIFLFVYATAIPDLLGTGELTALSAPIYFIRSLFRSLMFGSILGFYCGSLWGLYRFGKQRLKLKSFKEDKFLGVWEFGSLSFTFSSTYFLGVGLFTAQAIVGSMSGHSSPVNLIFMLLLSPLGMILFIAPLMSTHHRMVEAKEAEVASIRNMFGDVVYRPPETGEKEDLRLARLLALDAVERKTASIPTWPFATPVLGKLATIALTVVALIIARLIQILIGIA